MALDKLEPSLIRLNITVFLAFCVLMAMGLWQGYRLQWKNDIVAQIEKKSYLPAVELPEDVEKLDELLYRRIKLTGKFLNKEEKYLYTGAKELYSGYGYNILTPFLLENNQIILVDRGWIPGEKKLPQNRKETIIEDQVKLTAMLHAKESPARFTPDNDIDKNMWFWIDVKNMLNKDENIFTDKYYFRVIKKYSNTGLPIIGKKEIKHRNDHLQYMITWFSLAIILLIIYYLYRRQHHISRLNKKL